MAYSGLEFDKNNEALPMVSFKRHFDNIITIYTLSKTYGLAAVRAGVIISNEIVSSLIRDRIFQVSDSLSILQSSAISEIFDTNKKSLIFKKNYSYFVSNQYYERYIFTKAIIEGFKKLNNKEKITFKKILKENNILFKDDFFQGIDLINIEIEPNSGFFIIINVTKIIGKKYKDFLISDYRSLLKFLYTSVNIKILTGNAFCWPDKKEFVIRGTIALSYEDLLEGYLRFKMAINLLK